MEGWMEMWRGGCKDECVVSGWMDGWEGWWMDGFFVSLNLKKFLQRLHFFHGELFNAPPLFSCGTTSLE